MGTHLITWLGPGESTSISSRALNSSAGPISPGKTSGRTQVKLLYILHIWEKIWLFLRSHWKPLMFPNYWSPEEMYFWGALKWTHTMRLSGLCEDGEYKVIQWQYNKIRALMHSWSWCDSLVNLRYIQWTHKCLPTDSRGWGLLANTHLSISAVHHVVHHGGRRHWGQVSSLLWCLTCHRNRLLGQSKASPCCGILTKRELKKITHNLNVTHIWYIRI